MTNSGILAKALPPSEPDGNQAGNPWNWSASGGKVPAISGPFKRHFPPLWISRALSTARILASRSQVPPVNLDL